MSACVTALRALLPRRHAEFGPDGFGDGDHRSQFGEYSRCVVLFCVTYLEFREGAEAYALPGSGTARTQWQRP